MTVTIELFGIPRSRAKIARTEVKAANLAEALAELATRFPELGESCIDGDRLRDGLIANLNGDRFVSDPQTPLADGDSLLILSADAGG
jgi:molybdopterin converting factor small subunit